MRYVLISIFQPSRAITGSCPAPGFVLILQSFSAFANFRYFDSLSGRSKVMTRAYFRSHGVSKIMISYFLVERITEPSSGTHKPVNDWANFRRLPIGLLKPDSTLTILLCQQLPLLMERFLFRRCKTPILLPRKLLF